MDEFSKLAQILKHYKGYDYFMASIYIVMKNEDTLKAVIKEIYIPVAEQYHTTYRCVERDIRTVRDCIWEHIGKDETGKSRRSGRDKPSNRELIEMGVEHFK